MAIALLPSFLMSLESKNGYLGKKNEPIEFTFCMLSVFQIYYRLRNIKIIKFRSTAVEQVVAGALVTQRARVRSPVGTSFLGDVFSGFFLTYKTNVGKL